MANWVEAEIQSLAEDLAGTLVPFLGPLVVDAVTPLLEKAVSDISTKLEAEVAKLLVELEAKFHL